VVLLITHVWFWGSWLAYGLSVVIIAAPLRCCCGVALILIVRRLGWFFVGWGCRSVIMILFIVIPSKFIITSLVEEETGGVDKRPICIHIKAIIIVLTASRVSLAL